jgi:hypothetical protein
MHSSELPASVKDTLISSAGLLPYPMVSIELILGNKATK